MKSIKIFATVGAIALLGTTGFTSCNQKNGPEGPENYDGKTVKTEFSISIPEAGNAGNGGVLRMPSNKTQTDNPVTFLGMDNIILIPFNTVTSATAVDGNTPHWGANIDLSALGGNIGTNGLTNTTNADPAHYKVYENISIPLGTNHFLFYAHGTTGTLSEAADKFEKGVLSPSALTGNPSTFEFKLENVIGVENNTTYAKGADLVDYLNTIARAEYTTTNGTETHHHPWSTYTDSHVDDAGHHGQDAIQQLYESFITLEAGSSNSVLALVEDLYNTLEVYQTAYYTQYSANDPLVAALMTAILGDDDPTAAGRIITIKDGGTVGHREFEWKGTTLSGYPQNINLPDGAAAVKWNAGLTPAAGFEVASTATWHATNTSSNLPNGVKFCFPSSIYYYVNSPLKTATEAKLTGTDNVTANSTLSWAGIVARYGGSANTAVSANTRSVVIVNEIQYGVASLETTIKAGGTGTLVDSKGTPKNLSDINAKLTAILIGGQQSVGYNFVPLSDNPGTQIIYDKTLQVSDYVLSTTASTANPTLLLETNGGKNIKIAVEFLNQGQDFYGVDGKLIPKNTHFYVVAELSAAAAESETGSRVFMQDHKTKANLTLTSLANAYNVIPDLTTSGLELGFSVDLTWEEGHTYNVEF